MMNFNRGGRELLCYQTNKVARLQGQGRSSLLIYSTSKGPARFLKGTRLYALLSIRDRVYGAPE